MNTRLTRLWATKNKDDEWWSSFVTAPLAIAFNYVVVDIRWITPNRVTVVSFAVALLSVILIIRGGTADFVLAAILIQFRHVLDCMDGQIARYRGVSSTIGSYFDKVTDQVQVALWFGAVGYAGFVQSGDVLPVFLAATGIAFYNLRGYTKYVAIHSRMTSDSKYLSRLADLKVVPETAGPDFSLRANLRWFINQQPKVLLFDEGVFVFMLSAALVLDALTPMLWVFAASQIVLGPVLAWRNGLETIGTSDTPIQK